MTREDQSQVNRETSEHVILRDLRSQPESQNNPSNKEHSTSPLIQSIICSPVCIGVLDEEDYQNDGKEVNGKWQSNWAVKKIRLQQHQGITREGYSFAVAYCVQVTAQVTPTQADQVERVFSPGNN